MKLSYILYNVKQSKAILTFTSVCPSMWRTSITLQFFIISKSHGQSSRCQVRLLPPRRSRGTSRTSQDMDEHSTMILLLSIPFEVAQQKFQHFYNYGRNEFSPNLKDVAQKLDLPCPFDVLYTFGRKSKSEAPRTLKFCTKRFPIEVNNW